MDPTDAATQATGIFGTITAEAGILAGTLFLLLAGTIWLWRCDVKDLLKRNDDLGAEFVTLLKKSIEVQSEANATLTAMDKTVNTLITRRGS